MLIDELRDMISECRPNRQAVLRINGIDHPVVGVMLVDDGAVAIMGAPEEFSNTGAKAWTTEL